MSIFSHQNPFVLQGLKLDFHWPQGRSGIWNSVILSYLFGSTALAM